MNRATVVASSCALAALATLALAACERADAHASYAPGLGEIMAFTQMRHQKLWLAGQAENWPLAAYELDELDEGFRDAMAFHPTHKSSPVALTQVIPSQTDGPLANLRVAIEKKNAQDFVRAFDALTTACNTCHTLTNFAFNVVTRPASSAFPNQDFALPKK